MVRSERIELPTFRSGGERATNCAMTPKLHTQPFSVVLNFWCFKFFILTYNKLAELIVPFSELQNSQLSSILDDYSNRKK